MNYDDMTVDRFLNEVRPQLSAYTTMTLGCVAAKVGDDHWVLQAIAQLNMGAAARIPQEVFESDHLFATRLHIDACPHDLPAYIHNIRTAGVLPNLAGRKVQLKKPMDGRVSTYFQLPHPNELGSFRRVLSLGLTGERHSEVLRLDSEIDYELRVGQIPYDSIGELFGTFGLPFRVYGDATRIEIVAPPVVEFSPTSAIASNDAQVQLIASPTIDPLQVRLGWRCTKKGEIVDRRSIEGRQVSWETDGALLKGHFEFAVPQQSLALCWLSYGGRFQQQWWIFDPELILNPRRAIHECFDPGLKFLEELLLEVRSQKGSSRRFEDGVAYLAHLLGFRVVHFTSPLDDAPDVVATTANHEVLVIECTRDRLDAGGKLAKLKTRASQISRALSLSDHPNARVVPAIVTALGRSELADMDRKSAEDQGIAVVTADDLRDLLRQTRFAPDQHQAVFDRVHMLTTQTRFQFAQ